MRYNNFMELTYREQLRHFRKRRSELAKMHADGVPVSKLAKMYNTTTQNIYRLLREHKAYIEKYGEPKF